VLLRHAPDPSVTLDHETPWENGNWVILQFGNLKAIAQSDRNSRHDDFQITKFLPAGAVILRD
jgi:hypothetical protein